MQTGQKPMIEVHSAKAGEIECLARTLAQDRLTQLGDTSHRNTAAGHAEPVFHRTSAGVCGHHTKRWVTARIKGIEVFVRDDHDGVHPSRSQRLPQRAKTL